jgi:hypothetical protein
MLRTRRPVPVPVDPPVVHVDRAPRESGVDPDGARANEQQVEEAVAAFGGVFAGT